MREPVSPTSLPADQPLSRRKASAPDGAAAERQLARWIAEGDDEAVAELFELLGPTLYAVAVGITEDAAMAEGAVENTFTELWEKRAGLGRWPALSPWLTERCRFFALELRNGNDGSTPKAFAQASVDVPLAGRMLRCPPALRSTRVNAALEELSPDERQVVVLASRAGLPVSEIASRLGRRTNEVHLLLRTGLQSFRKTLERTLRKEAS